MGYCVQLLEVKGTNTQIRGVAVQANLPTSINLVFAAVNITSLALARSVLFLSVFLFFVLFFVAVVFLCRI